MVNDWMFECLDLIKKTMSEFWKMCKPRCNVLQYKHKIPVNSSGNYYKYTFQIHAFMGEITRWVGYSISLVLYN